MNIILCNKNGSEKHINPPAPPKPPLNRVLFDSPLDCIVGFCPKCESHMTRKYRWKFPKFWYHKCIQRKCGYEQQ